jgi:hypothetical protein
MAKTGRPKTVLSERQWDDFEKLCAIQCTQMEICNWFDLDVKTLNLLVNDRYKAPFSTVFRAKRGKGLVSLRRSQFIMAEKNVAMNIWLSKQFLNQREPSFLTEDDGDKLQGLAQLLGQKMVQVAGAGRTASNDSEVS